MRLATGQEALVARVVTKDGKAGFGFSFRLDATEAREMAEWHAGARRERPQIEVLLDHPWELAFVKNEPILWAHEPGFTALEFLPSPPPASSAPTR